MKAIIELSESSTDAISDLLTNHPIGAMQRENTIEYEGHVNLELMFHSRIQITVPPPNDDSSFQGVRKKLPVYTYRSHILEAINKNQVIIISGKTGKNSFGFFSMRCFSIRAQIYNRFRQNNPNSTIHNGRMFTQSERMSHHVYAAPTNRCDIDRIANCRGEK